MKYKFMVVIPNKIERVNLGFAFYETTKTFICEAMSLYEVHSKYPDAVSIQKLDEAQIYDFLKINSETLQ